MMQSEAGLKGWVELMLALRRGIAGMLGEGGGGEGLRHTAPKLGEQVASIHGREGSPPHMAPQSSPKTESFGSPGCQLE